MPLSPLQDELLLTLNAYLAGESSLDDVRGWELEQIAGTTSCRRMSGRSSTLSSLPRP